MQNNTDQTNQKDPHNRGQVGFEHISPGLCSIWLGWRDSNPRMHGPKPCALPLGHTPMRPEKKSRIVKLGFDSPLASPRLRY